MAIKQELLASLAKNTSQTLASDSLPKNGRSTSQHGAPSGSTMRKRHWFLSLAIIVGCGWITHSTTATIAMVDKTYGHNQSTASEPRLLTDAEKPLAFITPQLASIGTADVNATTNTPVPTEMVDQVAADSMVFNDTASAPLTPTLTLATPTLISQPYKIGKGESLGIIFRKMKLNLAIPHYISKHDTAKQLTSIRAGKVLDFRFDNSGALKELRYPINALQELTVSLDGNQISNAEVADLNYQTRQRTISGEITSSLYLAAQSAGLSNNLIMEMVRVFGWDIDFVQDIRSGDHFHVVFDEYVLGDKKLADGRILAAEFTTQGQTYRAIRFADAINAEGSDYAEGSNHAEGSDNAEGSNHAEGSANYYNMQGESMLGTFLRSPVEFSRISSRFGKRKHPISKKWKAHKGVDYAAARGTPIRATADGKVVLAGRKGGYGKTVVLRHAGRFSTLYAHMNGFAKGIRNGVRVKQGQTIGYVGSTGMSTGPHLHYEFRVDGVHRNSLTYKTPKASSISDDNMAKFNQVANELGQQLDSVKRTYELAKAGQKSSPEKG